MVLRDLCLLIVDSEHKTAPIASQGYPYIRTPDIGKGFLNLRDARRVTRDTYVNWTTRAIPQAGDLILAREAPVGNVAVIPEDAELCLGQRTVLLRPDPELTVARYLCYLLLGDSVQHTFHSLASGATVPHLNLSDIRKLEILLPPLPTQRKIASILSAYDDLIENNTRRIKILEEMAQNIYREWFVHFRFPGHENVQKVDSELGQIPEGWEVKRLGDVCSYLNRGISPKYDETSTSVVLNQRCIRDNKINFEPSRTHATKVSAKDKYLRFGDVLINSTGVGTLGRVAQVYENLEDCVVDSHVTIVRSTTEIASDYWGSMLINAQPYFEQLGMGATGQTELNRRDIASMAIVVPPQDIQEMFSLQGSPIRELAHASLLQNQNLRKTRDLLLPRLISGRLDVEDLDIAM